MSHKQEVGSKFYSLVDRYAFFYPQMSKTSGVNLEMSEVISLVGVGKTLIKQTNKGLAKKLFNNFLESDSHREIMDDKKLTKVNFQVGLNKRNAIYIVGVLSNKTLN